jgi:hypothetical protein
VYGDIGDAVTHRSLGAESYYVLGHTFYFFTLGTSPASIDPAHFRRAGKRQVSYSDGVGRTDRELGHRAERHQLPDSTLMMVFP